MAPLQNHTLARRAEVIIPLRKVIAWTLGQADMVLLVISGIAREGTEEEKEDTDSVNDFHFFLFL